MNSGIRLLVSRKGRTQGQLRDGQLLWKLRNVAGYQWIWDSPPWRMRWSVRKLLKKPIGDATELSRDTRCFLADQLSEDLSCFLAFYNRPGLWSLDKECPTRCAA